MRAPLALCALAVTLTASGSARAQSRLLSPLVESADARVGADRVRSEWGLTGSGSTLCLIDTGLDEAAFGDRIVARFDAHGAPLGHPLEARFGGAVGARSLDRRGHGTAMASIALALAPQAQIIVATAFDRRLGGFPDEAVVRAARFCRARVEEDPELDPRRLVTLLSLGGHDGAHDGTSALERALTELADRPMVVAAGNDGERAVHAAGRLLRGEEADVTVRIPRAAVDEAYLSLAVLSSTPFELSWDGESVTLDPRETAAHRLGGLHVELEPNADRLGLARLVLRGAAEGPLTSGRLTLRWSGPTRFDAWLADTRLGTPFVPAALGGPWLVADSLRIPATAPGLITVGASGSDDTPAAYSSRGPNQEGALIPDVVAPGGWMQVALSADLDEQDPENLVGGRPLPGMDGRVAIRGTSAAAAVVAGALLLWLEAEPEHASSAGPRLVASTRDPTWSASRGWGELDVPRLLSAPTPELEVVAARPLTPSDAWLHLAARGHGELVARLGNAEQRLDLRQAGQLRFALLPRSAGETVQIELWHDGRQRPSLWVPVVVDRTHPTQPGGGCRAAPGRPAGTGWALIALILLLRKPLRGRG